MSVARFLKQRAVRICAAGSYTLGHWYDPQGRPRSFACRTTRVSPFRMLIDAPVTGKIGDRLRSYFRDFGTFDGEISDTVHGGFLLELDMTRAERARLAEKLVWLEKKQGDPGIRDARQDTRYVPTSPHSALTLPDGRSIACFVIDVSLSGAAVSSEYQPEIGTPLAVGSCLGRVIRLLPDGFAVRFAEPMANMGELERRVITPPARHGRSMVRVEASESDEPADEFFLI